MSAWRAQRPRAAVDQARSGRRVASALARRPSGRACGSRAAIGASGRRKAPGDEVDGVADGLDLGGLLLGDR